MVLERVKKGVKKVLQLGALVGATMLSPLDSFAHQDQILIRNYINSELGSLAINHREGATEGYDASPHDFLYAKPPMTTWAPKITTLVEGYELNTDGRDTNAVASIIADLRVFIDNSSDIQGNNKLSLESNTNAVFGVMNPERHYVGEYIVFADYIGDGSGTNFHEKRNLRDIITSYGTWFNWQGPTNLNILASQTNENGEVKFGEYIHHRDWNSFYFQQPSDGSVAVSNVSESAAVTNTQRFVYDTMINSTFNVKVDANEGRHLRGLEVVLQDINTGDFNTNSFSFPTNAPYTYSYETNVVGAAGSNSVRNVEFGTNQYGVSLTSKYSPWFGEDTIGNPEATPNPVSHGGSSTLTINKYINNPSNDAKRLRFKEWSTE